MGERRGPRRDAAKERFWRRVIDGFDPGRTTIRAWCERHGVSEPSFYVWRRELAARNRRPERDAVRLVPVDITSPGEIAPREPATITIELPSGLRLCVPPERLGDVLDVLEARRC